MTGSERRSVFSLALLYSMRMLGLFMVLPVFMLLGQDLDGATPQLIGMAMGAYGLSQAFLQIPFGMLSDRVGRKPMILLGLALFCLGSLLAGHADSIYGVIAGRLLQGAGAIASVLMALLTDLTTEENRTKAMAAIGMSIGVSFSVALVLGPVIGGMFGLSGIFYTTAFLALVGVFIVLAWVPTPVTRKRHRDTLLVRKELGGALSNPHLLRLNSGIFFLHMILTATFVAVPLSLAERVGLDKSQHWWFYLSVMVTAFFSMVPFIIIGEKRRKMKPVFVGAVALLTFSMMLAQWGQSGLMRFWGALFLFFMAFNLLEATLPSLVSKQSPAGAKGTAMGIYSTSQFLGAFVGGSMGGYILSHWGLDVIYLIIAGVGLVWLFIAASMQSPSYSTSMLLNIGCVVDSVAAGRLSEALLAVGGVEDVVVLPEEGMAYLKVDKAHLDENALSAYGKLTVAA
ncbi:MAG: MFS transporter [Hahellaceae bacterium]|nr:MFS transporter [Hahellaceae bacterium]MCP5168573.1 MFS transporter [Hahellaceae bacterium]